MRTNMTTIQDEDENQLIGDAQASRRDTKTLAAAYADYLQEVAQIQPEDFPLETRPADVAEGILEVCNYIGPCVLSENPTAAELSLLTVIGGVDYCTAVEEWGSARYEVCEYNKRRKPENCKALPAPPDIPAA